MTRLVKRCEELVDRVQRARSGDALEGATAATGAAAVRPLQPSAVAATAAGVESDADGSCLTAEAAEPCVSAMDDVPPAKRACLSVAHKQQTHTDQVASAARTKSVLDMWVSLAETASTPSTVMPLGVGSSAHTPANTTDSHSGDVARRAGSRTAETAAAGAAVPAVAAGTAAAMAAADGGARSTAAGRGADPEAADGGAESAAAGAAAALTVPGNSQALAR
eukprot:365085-Chlamydomonas_euryale.AAC.3